MNKRKAYTSEPNEKKSNTNKNKGLLADEKTNNFNNYHIQTKHKIEKYMKKNFSFNNMHKENVENNAKEINSQNILISTNKKQNLNNIENHIDINTPSNSNEKTINGPLGTK